MVSVAFSAAFAVIFLGALTACANETTVCPGTGVNLECSVDPPVSAIQWKIWCECEGDSVPCQDTCTSTLPTEILRTDSETLNETLNCDMDVNSAIIFELSSRKTVDENDTLISSSMLNISVSQDHNRTRLCLRCLSQSPRYIQILGPPPPPRNFASYTDYTTATDVDVEVNFTWLSPQLRNNGNLTVNYVITINETSESTGTTNYTSTTSFTAKLLFNTTYLVAVYASICDETLTSDSLMTNLTLYMDESENSSQAPEMSTNEVPEKENSAGVREIVSSVVGGVGAILLIACLLGCFICLARKSCAWKPKSRRSASATDGHYSSDGEVCTDSIYNVLSHEKSKLKALGKREQQHIIVHQGLKDPSTQDQTQENINVGVPEGNYSMITLENIEQESKTKYAEVVPVSASYSEEYSRINKKAGEDNKMKYAELAIPYSEEYSRINLKAGNDTEYSEIGNSDKAMDMKSNVNNTAPEAKNTVLGLKDVEARDENASAHSDNENGDATDNDNIPPPIPPQLF